mmetsp:Transcript_8096/g.20116  ORF Transcript_8096/g.20116 Transcript_8096/m.20116 type:complete len:266 (-) Transcript_8096:60-857(-)
MTLRADTACRPKAYPSSPCTSNRDPSLSSASSSRRSRVSLSPSIPIRRFFSSLFSIASSIWSGSTRCSPDMSTSLLRSMASMSATFVARSLRGSLASLGPHSPLALRRAIWSLVQSWFTSLTMVLRSDLSRSMLTSSSSSLRHSSSTRRDSMSCFSASRKQSAASGRFRREGENASKLCTLGVPNEIRFFSDFLAEDLAGVRSPAPGCFGPGEKKLRSVSIRPTFFSGEGERVCGDALRLRLREDPSSTSIAPEFGSGARARPRV